MSSVFFFHCSKPRFSNNDYLWTVDKEVIHQTRQFVIKGANVPEGTTKMIYRRLGAGRLKFKELFGLFCCSSYLRSAGQLWYEAECVV